LTDKLKKTHKQAKQSRKHNPLNADHVFCVTYLASRDSGVSPTDKEREKIRNRD